MSKSSNAPVMQSPLHSFGLSTRAKVVDDSCGVWANEVPPSGYISLRGEPGNAAFVIAASKVLGEKLPIEPCTYASASGVKIMWLSPDEWMIACPRERLSGLLSEFGQALSGIRSQVADNSGGYTQVMVRGAQAAAALAHCTVYDLEHLAQGRIVGTTFGKSALYLHREGSGYCLLFRRSFADYVWRFLVRAAEPYGFGVARLDRPAMGAKGAAP